MSLKIRIPVRWAIVSAAVAVVAVVLAGSYSHWWPPVQQAFARLAGTAPQEHSREHDHAHEGDDPHADHAHAANEPAGDGHDHGPEGFNDGHDDHDEGAADHVHDDEMALELSAQAAADIGSDLYRVEIRPFARTISVPAAIVERPGRSQVQVTAPFTGEVTRIYRIEGEAVTPGTPLFDLRLTHEDLVDAQAEFLRVAEELEVVEREVARIAKVASEGAIAGKALLERQYEQQKLEAVLHAQRQRLLMHGLSDRQVEAILQDRRLLREMIIVTPEAPNHEPGSGRTPMQVQRLSVDKGQQVVVGQPLCTLADHHKLLIEGKAFEHDMPTLAEAAKENRPVTAVFPSTGGRRRMVTSLAILYLANSVETASRTFNFYVTLPNELVRDEKSPSGHRFISWRYKPGQRLRLRVPAEEPVDRIVLPAEAVVQDGAETYVYERNGDHFDRRTVRVEYRDQDFVVVADDGTLKPGVRVAVSGAYQIHLGMKNKGGAAVDPHAGHNH